MPTVDTVQTNFGRGQLADELDGRAETRIFRSGCKSLLNMQALVQGGVTTRDGTYYIARYSEYHRCIAFIFGKGQEYEILISLTQVVVWNVSADVPVLAITISAGIPWTTVDQIDDMDIAQKGDVMFLAHPDFETQVLTRTAVSTFTLGAFTFTSYSGGVSGSYAAEPFFPFQVPTTTLTKSGTSYTTSANHFTAAHVGSILRFHNADRTEMGFATITAYNSPTNVTATLSAVEAGTAVDAAYPLWDESMFSDAQGYAGTVGFSKARLGLGGSAILPSHYALSEATLFLSFRDTTGASGEVLETDAIIRPIIGDEVNKLIHMVTGSRLLLMTDGGVFYVPETLEKPITPSNIKEEIVSPHEVSQRSQPVVYNDSVLFVVEPGVVIREVSYDALQDTYTAPAISLTTNVVKTVKTTARQYARDNEHEQYAYFLNTDGTIAVYQGIKEEEISGFLPWATRAGDTFESISSARRKLFAIAKRNIDGTDYWFFEQFSPNTPLDCSFRASLDGSYAGGITQVAYSNTDLGSEEVSVVMSGPDEDAIWQDAAIYMGEYPNAASINLTRAEGMTIYTIDAIAGFNFDREIETMDAMPENFQGQVMYAKMKIAEARIKVLNTPSLRLQSGRIIRCALASDPTSQLIDIGGTDYQVLSAPCRSSGFEIVHPRGYDRLGRITIEFPEPTRSTVLAISRRVAVGD